MALYFIIEEKEGTARVETLEGFTGDTDRLQSFLKRCHINSLGMFGREEYAQAWTDYYNHKITREQLNNVLL